MTPQTASDPPREESAFAIARRIRQRDVSCVEVIQGALDRIDLYDSRFRFFVDVTRKQALERAQDLDARLARGEDPGPLTGVPVAKKVSEAPYAAARLETAGCILVGTTTCPNKPHPSGYQSWGANNAGPTANPWNPSRSSGGSSAGSGVAVAVGVVPIATAADGAGSTRIPAAWCGVLGLKTTRGLIPPGPNGVDVTRGPITRTVRDAGLYLDAVVDADRGWHREPTRRVEPILAAWSPTLGFAGTDDEVASVALTAALRFTNAEGIRLDDRHVTLRDPLPIFFEKGSGTVDLRGAHDAEINELFEGVQLLLTPTTPTRPCEHGDPGDGFHIHLTLPFNYSGHPAISIPAGFTSDGLPVGLQVVGRHYNEALLLELARQYESRYPWPVTPV